MSLESSLRFPSLILLPFRSLTADKIDRLIFELSVPFLELDKVFLAIYPAIR